MANFGREGGILGSAQKARNLSQSSGDREQIVNGIHGRHPASSVQTNGSEDGGNPLKRRSTDAGIDYPRRRATIAVSHQIFTFSCTDVCHSARFADPESHDAMARNRNVSFAPSLGRTAYTESQESSSTLVIS